MSHLLTTLGITGVLVAFVTAADSNATSTCTFTGSEGHIDVELAKNNCSTIILDSLSVPGNVTLNLENLNDGTNVCTSESNYNMMGISATDLLFA